MARKVSAVRRYDETCADIIAILIPVLYFYYYSSCFQGNSGDPGVVGLMGSPGKQVRFTRV